ncbi:uncharacterized protein [Dysidea avara]|uniref:uncharacterized protein n=1 Tax=Dysidea avara TaxID=196820 RepID=UPI00332BA409
MIAPVILKMTNFTKMMEWNSTYFFAFAKDCSNALFVHVKVDGWHISVWVMSICEARLYGEINVYVLNQICDSNHFVKSFGVHGKENTSMMMMSDKAVCGDDNFMTVKYLRESDYLTNDTVFLKVTYHTLSIDRIMGSGARAHKVDYLFTSFMILIVTCVKFTFP